MKIILMMALTADGMIARDTEHKADWTSKADKKSFIETTKKHGAVIMGRTTFDTIGRPLPERLNIILTRNPEKYSEKHVEGLLEFHSKTPKETIEYLESKGFHSAVLIGGAKTNSEFLAQGHVNEILITIEPILFGNGITFAEGNMLDIKLELLDTKLLDKNVLQVHYKVIG